jgi:hypothetical protein
MLKRVLALSLAWLMCTECVAARPGPQTAVSPEEIRSQCLAIPGGSLVEVKLKGQEKVRGKLGMVSNEGFALIETGGRRNATRRIAFGQAKSVKQVRPSRALSVAGWVFIGVVTAIVVAAAVIYVKVRNS